jgi:hypothetical protein
MFMEKASIALGQHFICDRRAFFRSARSRPIACSTRMQADTHHSRKVHIPGNFSVRTHPTIVKPETVKVTAVAEFAYAWSWEIELG